MSIPSAASTDGALPRIFEVDLKHVEYQLPFHGSIYNIKLQITAFGVPFYKVTNTVSILIENDKSQAAIDHYRKIVSRNPVLNHNNLQLQDHIEVILLPHPVPILCPSCAYHMPILCPSCAVITDDIHKFFLTEIKSTCLPCRQ